MPMQYTLYPRNWREIAARKKRAAGYRCRFCGARHGEMTTNRHGQPVAVQVGVAHLDHDVWNPRARTAVLCRRCHIRYDAKQRRRQRRMMAIARGQLYWKEMLYDNRNPAAAAGKKKLWNVDQEHPEQQRHALAR